MDCIVKQLNILWFLDLKVSKSPPHISKSTQKERQVFGMFLAVRSKILNQLFDTDMKEITLWPLLPSPRQHFALLNLNLVELPGNCLLICLSSYIICRLEPQKNVVVNTGFWLENNCHVTCHFSWQNDRIYNFKTCVWICVKQQFVNENEHVKVDKCHFVYCRSKCWVFFFIGK